MRLHRRVLFADEQQPHSGQAGRQLGRRQDRPSGGFGDAIEDERRFPVLPRRIPDGKMKRIFHENDDRRAKESRGSDEPTRRHVDTETRRKTAHHRVPASPCLSLYRHGWIDTTSSPAPPASTRSPGFAPRSAWANSDS
jgi:hypothetical protein